MDYNWYTEGLLIPSVSFTYLFMEESATHGVYSLLHSVPVDSWWILWSSRFDSI